MEHSQNTQKGKGKKTMMTATMKDRKSMGVFTRLARMSAITSLDEILEITTTQITELMEAAGCSVYLVPDVITNFPGQLFRDGQQIRYQREEHDHIIVLAATTRPDMKPYIGQAYYQLGEGITGWVYEHKIALNIKNTANAKELEKYSSDLTWKDTYEGSKYYYKDDSEKPLLIVPLSFNDRQLGVVKFLAKTPNQPFSDWDEKLAFLISKIVSSTLHHSIEIESQKKTILELIEIGSRHDRDEVFSELSKSMLELLRAEKSQVFLFNDEENSTLKLNVENGRIIPNGKTTVRGEGLVGWVYKTGKPLIIDDIRSFKNITYLSDEILEQYSDSAVINDSGREIFFDVLELATSRYPITFIAVPVKQDGEILGVLTAQSKYGNSSKRSVPFIKDVDLRLACSLAKIATSALEYEQERYQGELFLRLGYAKDIRKLFELVLEYIPKLVSSAGCSIFEFKKDAHGPYLHLVQTSRQGFIQDNSQPVNLQYKLGEDKTGLCGLSRCTMIFNHYGAGEISEDAMDKEITRVEEKFPDDYVGRLINAEGIQEGLIQVRAGKSCPKDVIEDFRGLSSFCRIHKNGLSSQKVIQAAPDAKPSWSFAAIPIKDGVDLFGTITVSRPVAENPFSRHDINTLEAVASRLGHFIGNIKLQEQRKELLMALAHEVNTPLTGILADSENLKMEVNDLSMKSLAENIIEQVMRLQLFTETIMGAVPGAYNESDGVPIEFEYIPIEKLLSEACKMFKSEAKFKGCEILDPTHIGDDNFPVIEMSRFHLEIAIKNLVHNAVKYSYRPSKSGDKKRFIKIWGIWPVGNHQSYKISIQNFGVGISQQEIDKRLIFEPFYRGKKAGDRRRTGAGFGLSYSRQIIEEMHRGKITVTSVPAGDNPEGKPDEPYLTTFTITLPVIQTTLRKPNQK